MNFFSEEKILMHYGMPRRSGRYPWGSGEDPYQHLTGGNADLYTRVREMRKSGLSDTAIVKALGLSSTTELRAQYSLAKDQHRADLVATARGLRDKGYSLNEIAEKMGFKNDSSVRSLLNEKSEARMNQARSTADFLKKMIDEKGMVDVGVGVERELGISQEKLKQALYILEQEGYPVYGGRVPQATNPGRFTTITVACPPDTQHKDIYNYGDVHSVTDYISYDRGDSFKKAFEYPSSLDPKRLQIKYAEEGGIDKDGVIELRRGVADLSLGDSHYAQVRIMVDGGKYLKGMAVYSDDLPDGVDVRFNTNKKKGTPMEDVLKDIKDDPDNPFGSLIKEHGGQSYYDDPNGKYVDPVTGKKQSLSLINKRADEGDWGSWGDTVPSQFLAKQPMELINTQLSLTKAEKKAEFDEICSLTNPTVKRVMLESFANDCDSAAVHLKAASFPRQKYQVIMPLTSVKDNEVYAPNYKDGETVALVRFPHGGTFEIPILTVNNKNREGRKVLGTNPADAVGINKSVADRLSGADFDGDTVMVIPCNSPHSNVHIQSTDPAKSHSGLRDLAHFDTKLSYGPDSSKPVKVDKDGNEYYSRNGHIYKRMANTQNEMGKVSNLITDMTLKGATDDEIARAVRHSMVVIDAEKHKLDYQQSFEDNGIAALKKKYQGHMTEDGRYSEGASTLLSRASAEVQIPKRRGSAHINEDGTLSYKESEETYTDKNGKVKLRTETSTQMAETNDARTLSSGTRQENAYADYANYMKDLANKARRTMMATGRLKYDANAKAKYAEEVKSLNAKLDLSLRNAPRERQAQFIANSVVSAKKAANPNMSKAEIKKANQQAVSTARDMVGARRQPINITDKEWEAIQSGAVSDHQLKTILDNADIDSVRKRATPRASASVSTAKKNQAKAMAKAGYTNAEIADRLGLSASKISALINE